MTVDKGAFWEIAAPCGYCLLFVGIGIGLDFLNAYLTVEYQKTIDPAYFSVIGGLGTLFKYVGMTIAFVVTVWIAAWRFFLNNFFNSQAEKRLEKLSALVGEKLDATSNVAVDALSVLTDGVSEHLDGAMQKMCTWEYGNKCKNRPKVHADYISDNYGAHSVENDSYYNFCRGVLVRSYCNSPYKLKQRHKITVKEKEGGLDGFFEWTDELRYTVVDPLYGKNNLQYFPIRSNSISKLASEDQAEEWIKEWNLRLFVNGEEILLPPPVKGELGVDGEHVWRVSDGYIYVNFERKIELSAKETSFRVIENCLNLETDFQFWYTLSQPTKGLHLVMNLPKGYVFNELPTYSPEILYAGIPDEVKKTEQYKKPSVAEDFIGMKRLHIKDDNWVLPGLLTCIEWAKE